MHSNSLEQIARISPYFSTKQENCILYIIINFIEQNITIIEAFKSKKHVIIWKSVELCTDIHVQVSYFYLYQNIFGYATMQASLIWAHFRYCICEFYHHHFINLNRNMKWAVADISVI